VSFSEALDGVSARSPANYELIFAGADGLLDTLDDVRIGVTPAYSFPETDLSLQFNGGVLGDGLYRLRISGTLAVYDTAGNALDGDNDGFAGGDYQHVFTVDRSANNAPVANAQTVDVQEDGSLIITLTGSDPDGDALNYSLASQPLHGTLVGFDPVTRQVTYIAAPDYWGPDSFQFQVDDGKLGVALATISVNVLPVNDAPLAPGQTVNVFEDLSANVFLPASDKETPRAGLTFTLVTGPSYGTLEEGTNGVWVYTPDPEFSGVDSFTYTVTDRGADDADPSTALTSTVATMVLNVNTLNDGPTLAAIADIAVDEGEQISFSLVGADADGDTLSYSLVSGPAGATVDPVTGVFNWLAADGDVVENLTVRASDGKAYAERSFRIAVSNVAPSLAASGAAEAAAGTLYTLTLAASDPGDDTLIEWVVNWGDGNVTTLPGSATSASHTYLLDGNYNILVSASDEDGSYQAAPVSVAVLSTNLRPTANAQSVATDEDTALAIQLGGSDPDSDPLTFSIVVQPSSGSLSGLNAQTGSVTYTPASNFFGADSFQFQVSDGKGGTSVATVSIEVRAVNDAPTLARIDDQMVAEGDSVSLMLVGADVDFDTLNYSLISGPTGASVDPTTGLFTWLAADGPVVENVTVRVSDGSLVAERSFAITVANVAPTLSVTGASTVAQGATYSIQFSATDPGADTIEEWTVDWGDGNVDTLSGTATEASHVYTTAGAFSVRVSATDEDASYDALPIDVVVSTVGNLAPVADAQSVATDEDTGLAIQLSGSDADGGTLSYAIATPPTHGTLSGFNAATGQVTYTPDADYFGSDSFVFSVADGQGGTATATVSIQVAAVNDAPTLAPIADQMVNEGQTVSVSLIGSDVDGPGADLQPCQWSVRRQRRSDDGPVHLAGRGRPGRRERDRAGERRQPGGGAQLRDHRGQRGADADGDGCSDGGRRRDLHDRARRERSWRGHDPGVAHRLG
jgi:PKD repeat protein